MGGIVEKIIPRNSRVPTGAKQVFTTPMGRPALIFTSCRANAKRQRVSQPGAIQTDRDSKMAAGMARLGSDVPDR